MNKPIKKKKSNQTEASSCSCVARGYIAPNKKYCDPASWREPQLLTLNLGMNLILIPIYEMNDLALHMLFLTTGL